MRRSVAEIPRETIFALATGPGRAGVAIIRVSGPNAVPVLEALTRAPLPKPRLATIRTLYGKTNARLDDALVLRFEAPNSYTGEDVVEFHLHGGRAVIQGVLEALAQGGLKPADPGEFTRRAVENGRLDLTQAEAIADLIEAETEAQRIQALRQLGGAFGALAEAWRARLIRAAAWIEAAIDFPDEDIPPEAAATSRAELLALAAEITAHLDDGRRGEILREGLHVAVIGPPNAGKSSLVNALAQRDVVIVSDIAGTTRDVVEVRLDLGGYPVILADTAGLRATENSIEQEGVRRAVARAKAADLRLLVLDGATPEAMDVAADVVVFNKADLVPQPVRVGGIWMSTRTGEGLDRLVAILTERAKERFSSSEAPLVTRARHRSALGEALAALRAALGEDIAPELAAEHVRVALQAIGRITGRVDLDELLDVVFRDFCIGK